MLMYEHISMAISTIFSILHPKGYRPLRLWITFRGRWPAYAEPLAGLTMADFNGEWVFVDAEYVGQVLDAETLGMSADLHIQDGKGHLELVYDDGTEVYDAVCEIEEIEELGTVMYFFYTDPATGEATEYGMLLVLYNDGELVWYETDEADNDIFYCFENVANVPD